MGNTLYSNIGHNSSELDEIYCKYLNNLYNIYNYLFKYEHFFFMNSLTLNCFCHVLEGINKNEGHVLIKICKLKNEMPKIKRILYTLKFLFSFDLFPNVLPYNRMSVYENNIYIYRRFIFKNLDHCLSNEKNSNSFYYFFIFQIFLSIIQLHSLGIYHGHIKSENFLIQNNMHVLITDINILNNYLYYIPKISYPISREVSNTHEHSFSCCLTASRYANKRKGRLKRLQEDLFNLGILILEILLKDKNISYLFLNENYGDDNNSNFYSEKRKQTKLYFVENDMKKDQKFGNIMNMSEKKNSEHFVHALSLPFINKKIKNEEKDYFQKNKNLRLNIDKYKYYNYHYINNVNYINIYNDIYNNVTPSLMVNERNIFSHGSYENSFKSKTLIYDSCDEHKGKKEIYYAYSDYEMLNEKKGTKYKHQHNNLNLHTQSKLHADNTYTLFSHLKATNDKHQKERKKRKRKKKKNERYINDGKGRNSYGSSNGINGNSGISGSNDSNDRSTGGSSVRRVCGGAEKTVPYKIWKVVNVVKNPFIIYSLINHFFLQKNMNIFKIFNYWSYHVFPSTYKYVFFPLAILQLHPIFKNSDFFMLLIHFNLPFILFHLDIFAQKERDKYALLKIISNQNIQESNNMDKHYNYDSYEIENNYGTSMFYSEQKHTTNLLNFKKLTYYKNVVNSFTTSVNKYQMKTYIMDTNLNSQVKKQIMQQWKDYKREKRAEKYEERKKGASAYVRKGKKKKKKVYHSKCYFPFPILSYRNTREFYKSFLSFYKVLFYSIFYEEKSYMDLFNYLEICKRTIYSSLFKDFYFKVNGKRDLNEKGTNLENRKNSTSNPGKHMNYRWIFNKDIYQLVNIIICSYNSLLYESTRIIALEILYCIICHITETTLNREVVSFLLFCFNNSNEKIKVIIIKCFYKIINNENCFNPMFLYIDKFLPKLFTLKDSQENYEKYFYAKYLPLFSSAAVHYIYSASLLKNGRGIGGGKSSSNCKREGKIEKSSQSYNKNGNDSRGTNTTLSEVKSMEMLKEIRNQLVNILKCSNHDILYEFYENIIKFCKIMNRKWVKFYILPYILTNIYKPQNPIIRAMCVKICIKIILYINEKEAYEMFYEYLKPLLFEKNEIALQFFLYECNLILKKYYRKCRAKYREKYHEKKHNKMCILFFKRMKLNHLLNHQSLVIRHLVQTLKKNLQKISP
ncbi:serine/threonine protein kinase VPS15, putative [Plasmodium malariae]|uniref:Serine/threonine protein kinase VPS15, putative n=1 Tax=Plasmodium malariae TaxID=5858 RepID=A0A1D3JL90_PLAMA|nr:serine/threonine protein kinase VPS15, putative [Plasmodium malariae]SBT87367.1 serine/threonine protein kinase VPS15, putative [Plasmodium malariae]